MVVNVGDPCVEVGVGDGRRGAIGVNEQVHQRRHAFADLGHAIGDVFKFLAAQAAIEALAAARHSVWCVAGRDGVDFHEERRVWGGGERGLDEFGTNALAACVMVGSEIFQQVERVRGGAVEAGETEELARGAARAECEIVGAGEALADDIICFAFFGRQSFVVDRQQFGGVMRAEQRDIYG